MITILIVASLASFQEEEEALRQEILPALKAGYEQHDLKRYLSVWSPKARRIRRRTDRQGKYDLVLDFEELKATRELQFHNRKSETKLEFSNVKVKIEKDKATLFFHSRFQWAAGARESIAEVLKLRRLEGKWRIMESIFWIRERTAGEKSEMFNAKFWATKDAHVEKARTKGRLDELFMALMLAYREREAHMAAWLRTREEKDNAQAWADLAFAASVLGKADEARKLFQKALRMDPKVWVPDWARQDKRR